MNIGANLESIKSTFSTDECTLVAVSKTKPHEDILEAYKFGQRDFGENKVQELREKSEELPKDIRWHMIGHLQTNKVKYIAPFIHLIHAVDSVKLLKEIDKQARKHDRVIDCLIQIHIARESTKFGMDETDLNELLNESWLEDLKNIRISGLMGMATYTDDSDLIRSEFKYLKSLFDRVNQTIKKPNIDCRILSMGMSDDYKIAIEEGSTMVRVGSKIFGERNYQK